MDRGWLVEGEVRLYEGMERKVNGVEKACGRV
jgi:hypothetical protein